MAGIMIRSLSPAQSRDGPRDQGVAMVDFYTQMKTVYFSV